MIVRESINAIEGSTDSGIVRPLYGSYCFSEIVPYLHSYFSHGETGPSPLSIFTPSGCDAEVVVLFLIDGFGWHLFERLSEKTPLLKKLIKHGTVGALTSQFPSTTTAHITSIHAGLSVPQTGIIEWTAYEPILGRIIEPITYHYLRRDLSPQTFDTEAASDLIFPFPMHYEALSSFGTSSHILIDHSLAGSRYSQKMHRGALTTPFSGLIDGLQKLTHLISTAKHKTFIYFYFDLLDSLAHRNGAYGPRVYAAAHDLFKKIDRDLISSPEVKLKNPLLLFTADHGLTDAHFKDTLYLDELYPNLLSHIKRDPNSDELIAPVGSSRDLFLFLRDDARDQVISDLKQILEGKAVVLTTEECIKRGFWGDSQSMRLMERIGDAVVLPDKNQTVWIREGGKWQTKFMGYHGGLSPEEMTVPFISWRHT